MAIQPANHTPNNSLDMTARLHRLGEWLRATEVRGGWIKVLRGTLGMIFVAAGSLKLAGHNIRDGLGTYAPGTQPVDPVAPFFAALFAVKPYWFMIGLGQLLGGALLLTARTTAAGLVVTGVMLLNIAVLIFALPFATADRVAVVLMSVDYGMLLVYEWPRFAPLFGEVPHPRSATAAVQDAWARRGVRIATWLLVAAWMAVHVRDVMND